MRNSCFLGQVDRVSKVLCLGLVALVLVVPVSTAVGEEDEEDSEVTHESL